MRLISTILIAAATLAAGSVTSPAQAYCRGCAVSPEAAAAAAAAAVYGSAVAAGASAQASEPPPMPNSRATYAPANAKDNTKDCNNPGSRTWTAGSDLPSARVDKCD